MRTRGNVGYSTIIIQKSTYLICGELELVQLLRVHLLRMDLLADEVLRQLVLLMLLLLSEEKEYYRSEKWRTIHAVVSATMRRNIRHLLGVWVYLVPSLFYFHNKSNT